MKDKEQNILVKDLLINDDTSLDFCKKKKIETIYDLEKYFQKKLDIFYDKKQKKKKKKLNNLIRFLLDNIVVPEEFKTISVSEILDTERASERCYGVCENANIDSLYDFIQYFKQYTTFINIQHCGVKSNIELIRMSYRHLIFQNLINSNINKDDKYCVEESKQLKGCNLHLIDKSIVVSLNSYIIRRINALSNRSKNVLNEYLEFPFDIFVYQEKIINEMKNLKQTKNIGKTSIDEINKINKELELLFFNLAYSNNSRYEIDFKQLQLLSNNIYNISEIDEEYYDEFQQKRFKLFRFINYAIKGILSDQEQYILQNYVGLNYFTNSKNQSLRLIGEDLGLSWQRVQQLEVIILNKLKMNFRILSYFLKYTNYNINLEIDIIILDSETINKINRAEGISFSNNYYIAILRILSKQDFVLIKRHKKNETFKDFLIKKEYFTYFDFNEFIQDIDNRMAYKVKKAYNLPTDYYIKEFLIKYDEIIFNKIKKICIKILEEEYTEIIPSSRSINFLSNTKKKLDNYIVEILEVVQEPLTSSDLLKEYRKLVPNATMNSLKGIINNSSQIKYMRGGLNETQKSVYILEKWEQENRYKSGSIRDIVLDLLENESKPLHVDEIFHNVKNIRKDITKESIYSNLRSDINSFCILPLRFFGISARCKELIPAKQYPPHLVIYGKRYIIDSNNNIKYKSLLKYLVKRYGLNYEMVKLIFDKCIKYGEIILVEKVNRASRVKLSLEEMSKIKK